MDSRAPSRSAIHQNDIGLHARAELRAAGGEPSHLTGLQKALSIESLDLCEPKSRHIFRKGIDARAFAVMKEQAVTVATRHWWFFVMPNGTGLFRYKKESSARGEPHCSNTVEPLR